MGVGRVAVVVAAGVGDKPRGDAAERIANGLRLFERYDEPVQHAEWYEVPDVAIQPVDRFETGHNGIDVDIYEFWWADLSRFPAAARSFLAAFFGLFLALSSVGRTALRRTTEIGVEPQKLPPGSKPSDVDYHLLGFLSWIVAVPVVVLSAQLLMTVAALAIAIAVPDSAISGAFAVGLFGAGTSVVGLLLLRRYRIMSGRRGAFVLGVIALAGATAVCVTRLVERGVSGKSTIELALADTVAVLVAYPMRILWLSVLAFVVVIAVVLGVKCCRRDSRLRRHAVRRTITAGLTVSFGPLGFAVLMAILSAAVGGLAKQVGPTVLWGGPRTAGQTPWCLSSPDSWTLVDCPTLTAWRFGTLTLGDAIFALACALVVVLGVLALYLVTLLVGEIVRRVHSSSSESPASRQAARLSFALDAIGGLPAAIVLVLAAFAASYAAAAAWLPFFPLPDGIEHQVGLVKQSVGSAPKVHSGWAPTVAGVLGVLVSGLLLAARAMGMTPQQLASDSTASNVLRLILDKPYDIATFLREPVGPQAKNRRLVDLDEMPRQKMLARYRALLVFLRARGYDRVVFAAHSQGTVLTATLLHEKELPLPDRVSMITFGCPLRQLYSERFPSQYSWVRQPERVRRFVPHVTEQWINVWTAGDPVGRTVFADVPGPGVKSEPPENPAGDLRLEDVPLGTAATPRTGRCPGCTSGWPS